MTLRKLLKLFRLHCQWNRIPLNDGAGDIDEFDLEGVI
jgi:hypothetical protein